MTTNKGSDHNSDIEMSSQSYQSHNEGKESSVSCGQAEDQHITPVVTRPCTPHVDRSNQASFIQDVTRSVPSNQIEECVMRREKRGPFGSYVYQFFGQDTDPIFTARSKSTPLHCKYMIYEPLSGKIIGNIISDAKCLKYNVTGPESFKQSIEYVENFLGRHGCRSFKVKFDNSDSAEFISKPPITINGNYYQDFHDMETMQSIKNFVCVDKEDFNKEVCLFVRSTTEDCFILRIAKPFTLFAGFSLALTSLHTGIFHR